ncbi:hypothetical protein VCV18_007321 [Metarhizium anisopliae]
MRAVDGETVMASRGGRKTLAKQKQQQKPRKKNKKKRKNRARADCEQVDSIKDQDQQRMHACSTPYLGLWNPEVEGKRKNELLEWLDGQGDAGLMD